MNIPKIFESEYRFMQVLWENEPVNSTKLVTICKEKLGWSKATTYTVIRRLSERGVLVNEDTIVRSLVTKEQVQTAEIDELVHNRFADSLPAFVAAFTKNRKLSEKEIDEIQLLIDSYRKGDA